MKKTLMSLTFILAGLFAYDVHAWCVVRNESDLVPDNHWTLRFNIENAYKQSVCSVSADSGKYDFAAKFDQSIRFQTFEWGILFDTWIDIENIVLTDKLTFNNKNKSLVLGNFSSLKPENTSYDYEYPADVAMVQKDYGLVTLDAKTNFEEKDMPFDCAKDTKPVTLRSLIILTNKISKKELFESETCLRDGGEVYVCGGTRDPHSVLDAAGWCDESDNGGNNGGGNGKNEVCDNFDDKGIAIDDDGDDTANCLDPECFDDAKCDDVALTEDCYVVGDEDGNKLADCDDAYCATQSMCNPSSEIESDPIACGDLEDNDKDGKIDCDDDGCEEYCGGPAEVCDDLDPLTNEGIDNDGDTKANCADPDCLTDEHCNHAVEDVCDDWLDNDHDGSIDCNDPNCANESHCIDTIKEVCGDAAEADEDGNGLSNCKDPACEGDIACDPINIDDDKDGFSETAGDCNDADNTVYPGNTESCGDAKDNNCNEQIEEGCAGKPDEDDDGDGFCENVEACASTDIKPGDCDDTNVAINPEAVEVCDDNINNDCDAATSDAGAPVEDPATDGTLNPLIKKVVDGGGLSCSTSPLPEDKGSGASGGGCGCDISQKPGAIHQVNMTLVILGLMLSLIPVGLRLSKKD